MDAVELSFDGAHGSLLAALPSQARIEAGASDENAYMAHKDDDEEDDDDDTSIETDPATEDDDEVTDLPSPKKLPAQPELVKEVKKEVDIEGSFVANDVEGSFDAGALGSMLASLPPKATEANAYSAHKEEDDDDEEEAKTKDVEGTKKEEAKTEDVEDKKKEEVKAKDVESKKKEEVKTSGKGKREVGLKKDTSRSSKKSSGAGCFKYLFAPCLIKQRKQLREEERQGDQ